MQNMLNEYLLFILKLTTIGLLPLIIISLILYMFKTQQKNNINIININKKYLSLQKHFYQNTCNKKTYKENAKHLQNSYKTLKKSITSNLFIINFNGDINAKNIIYLKDIISTIILIGKKNDEVLLNLTSGGGLINNYGLAASLFKRIKNNNIKLTISVDLIAASGGYLIASVADKLIASQFAIIGSIGVIGVIPNFNKLLNKNNIEIEHHTAGEYKST